MALFTVGQVLTAAELNQAINNSTYVTGTGASTASTSYVNPAGMPAVAFTVNTRVRVFISANLQNLSAGETSFVSVALSGTNTVAATDGLALWYLAHDANEQGQFGTTFEIGGLSPGSTTFTMKVRAGGGTAVISNCIMGIDWRA
jgi:hypothetical protein